MCQNLANSYKCFDIAYKEKKPTWSNFNILRDNIWTKENLMHGIEKLLDEFFWKY
jgi:hypothetical protein